MRTKPPFTPKWSGLSDRLQTPARAPRRRQVLQWPLAAGALAWGFDSALGQAAAQAQPSASLGSAAGQPAGGVRLALLIGNRDYPQPYDLPSIHKNVRDLEKALEGRGFQVTAEVDLDLARTRQVVEAFAARLRQAPPDAVVFFYFSGHGVQVDAENLLVAAGTNPAAADAVVKGSIVLGPDVVGKLPRPARGLTMAVVDACRTDLRAARRAGDGLNQVEAPPGCLIAFSTGAGKPALAPNNDRQNTFYTASLVKVLNTASDELSFSDLFRLVKLDTQRTMLNHPLALIRQFAQFPFIAENTREPLLLARASPTDDGPAATVAAAAAAAASAAVGGDAAVVAAVATPMATPVSRRFSSEDEARDWAELQATIWPPDVLRLAEQFMQRHPDSKLRDAALVAGEGAREAAAILKRPDVRLFRRSFDASAYPEATLKSDLLKAARGDKDAAARVGRRWASSATRGPQVARFEGWMAYAAELGNGIASYELALHFRRLDLPLPAARWESRATELGYTPPPSLDNTRK